MVLLPPRAIESTVLSSGLLCKSTHLLPAHTSVCNHMGVAGIGWGQVRFQLMGTVEWNHHQLAYTVGTCESLYSVKTSRALPTILIDTAIMSVTPSLNL